MSYEIDIGRALLARHVLHLLLDAGPSKTSRALDLSPPLLADLFGHFVFFFKVIDVLDFENSGPVILRDAEVIAAFFINGVEVP